MIFILLALSIALSSCRNLFSKKLSDAPFGTREFFKRQGVLFICGAFSIIVFKGAELTIPSGETAIYAVLYALFLVFAQWFYTIALSKGSTSMCSCVYSMGFVIPTVAGAFLWSEQFVAFDFLGVALAVAAVICSARPSEKRESAKSCFIPLSIATICSGGLGVLQKVQQKSTVSGEKATFLLTAFVFAALISFIGSIFASRNTEKAKSPSLLTAASVGVAFGCCNLLNTGLAGALPAAIFFPTLNIGTIMLTMILGLIIFKERIKKREVKVLLLGGASILILNLT